jgi:hypothetical protein
MMKKVADVYESAKNKISSKIPTKLKSSSKKKTAAGTELAEKNDLREEAALMPNQIREDESKANGENEENEENEKGNREEGAPEDIQDEEVHQNNAEGEYDADQAEQINIEQGGQPQDGNEEVFIKIFRRVVCYFV